MKNVKRWLALGMAAMMTAGVLAGCGSTSTDTASDSSESTATETTETAGRITAMTFPDLQSMAN